MQNRNVPFNYSQNFNVENVKQPPQLDNIKVNNNQAMFGVSNQISSNIPFQINLKNSSHPINTHSIHPSKSNRSFSVDSDVMSNHTLSSEDSACCVPDSKENFSSQFNNLNTASNAALLTKEEAITSLLCSPFPKIPDSSQHDPSLNQPKLSINMTAQEIFDRCNKLSPDAKIIASIVTDDGSPPYPPDPPYPPLPKEKLNPPTPSVYVNTLF